MSDDSSESDDSHSNDNFSMLALNGEISPELPKSKSEELEENISKSKNFGSFAKLKENLGDKLKSSKCITIPKGAKPEDWEKIMEACNP